MEKTAVKKSRAKRVLLVLGIVLAALLCVFFIFAGSYHRADADALALLQADGVRETADEIVLTPSGETDTGVIFYPGARVEAAAYLPLLQRLQQDGSLCVLVRMPFHLAFFGKNAAADVMAQYPQIRHWYLAGHSLGGAMASAWASGHPGAYDGVLLLGSYVYGDVPAEKTLVVYGSEDHVLNYDHLTGGANEHVIAGGNHAQFGNYGLQQGDGTATVSAAAQQAETAELIRAFMQTQK